MRSRIHSRSVSCDVQSDRLFVLVDQDMYERRGGRDSRGRRVEGEGGKEEKGEGNCEAERSTPRWVRYERGLTIDWRDKCRATTEPTMASEEDRWRKQRRRAEEERADQRGYKIIAGRCRMMTSKEEEEVCRCWVRVMQTSGSGSGLAASGDDEFVWKE